MADYAEGNTTEEPYSIGQAGISQKKAPEIQDFTLVIILEQCSTSPGHQEKVCILSTSQVFKNLSRNNFQILVAHPAASKHPNTNFTPNIFEIEAKFMKFPPGMRIFYLLI